MIYMLKMIERCLDLSKTGGLSKGFILKRSKSINKHDKSHLSTVS